MALTFPRADIQSVRIAIQKPLQLVQRQELSHEASGVTRGKDLGPALWSTEITTTVMTESEIVEYLARINSLDGVINAFVLYEKRRPYPKNYADGNFNDTGTLFDVSGSDLHQIKLANLPASFALSAGDMLAFSYGSNPVQRALHQVVEPITADGSGLTGFFEIRPAIRNVALVDGVSPAISVTFKKPAGWFFIVPGSVQTNEINPFHASVSFRAMQAV